MRSKLSDFQRGAIRAACVYMWEPFRRILEQAGLPSCVGNDSSRKYLLDHLCCMKTMPVEDDLYQRVRFPPSVAVFNTSMIGYTDSGTRAFLSYG